jgi:hypothetical protein
MAALLGYLLVMASTTVLYSQFGLQGGFLVCSFLACAGLLLFRLNIDESHSRQNRGKHAGCSNQIPTCLFSVYKWSSILLLDFFGLNGFEKDCLLDNFICDSAIQFEKATYILWIFVLNAREESETFTTAMNLMCSVFLILPQHTYTSYLGYFLTMVKNTIYLGSYVSTSCRKTSLTEKAYDSMKTLSWNGCIDPWLFMVA